MEVDAIAAVGLMVLADVVELVVEVFNTAEAKLVRKKVVEAVEVVAVGVIVVSLGPVRVVLSVATPEENTLDGVLQH